MRVPVTLVIEMTDEQVSQYAAERGIPAGDGWQYAREVAADVRSYVLTVVQDSAVLGETGDGDGTRGAAVSIKR